MNARELRLWHWRRCLTTRARANKHGNEAANQEARNGMVEAKFQRRMERQAHKEANFHLSAVQMLNDHPACLASGTTAEQDALLFPDKSNRRKNL